MRRCLDAQHQLGDTSQQPPQRNVLCAVIVTDGATLRTRLRRTRLRPTPHREAVVADGVVVAVPARPLERDGRRLDHR
jgi:hypothetical protein